jgi:hypothetical protein
MWRHPVTEPTEPQTPAPDPTPLPRPTEPDAPEGGTDDTRPGPGTRGPGSGNPRSR